jgi:DNA polymerase-3 subunit gamma/tau
MAVSNERPQAMAAVQPMAMASQAPVFKSLEDLAAFAQKNNAPLLRFQLENNVHLVKLEPGRLEFRPARHAPPSLAADLAQKLKDWTGTRWLVTVAREGGALTLAEQKQAVKQARYEAVLQQPIVRAVLDRFPGAEIMAVRDVAGEDTAAPMPESDSDSDDE